MPFPYIFHVKNKGEAMPFSLKLKVNPKLGMLICGGTKKSIIGHGFPQSSNRENQNFPCMKIINFTVKTNLL